VGTTVLLPKGLVEVERTIGVRSLTEIVEVIRPHLQQVQNGSCSVMRVLFHNGGDNITGHVRTQLETPARRDKIQGADDKLGQTLRTHLKL
jgi:hypothetical protein